MRAPHGNQPSGDCPSCGRPGTLAYTYDDGTEEWHCDHCGNAWEERPREGTSSVDITGGL